MKRIIKASIKNADKLKQIERSRYDSDWQEQGIQEIADYLDPYAIDVEIDEVTEDGVAFTVYQPQYPEAGELYYSISSAFKSLNQLSSRAGSRRRQDLQFRDILVDAMIYRFNKCLGDTLEYISPVQEQINNSIDLLEHQYNIQLNAQVSYLAITKMFNFPGLMLNIYFDSSSSIIIDKIHYKFPESISRINFKSRYTFIEDMTPSSFLQIFTIESIESELEDSILRDVQRMFLDRADIVADAVSILNSKFAKSKYDVVARADNDIVECVFNHESNSYTFDIGMENYFQAIFDIWFNDSNRNYEGAIDFAVKNLYKRIAAKCRRLAAKYRGN